MSRATALPTFWVVLLATLLLLTSIVLWWPRLGIAQPGAEVGRYQISSWASYAGERVHIGYYSIDTTTG